MIDAHQHFWDLSQPFDYRWLKSPGNEPIDRDFLPADLAPHLAAAGVAQSIVVQTQHDLAENDWALGIADANGFIAGVVGWVDLQSPDCERQVERCKRHPKFVGVRHVAQDEPDDDWLVRPAVLDGLAVLENHGLPFDVLIYVKHLHHVPTLARRFPTLRLIINHLAKPAIKSHGYHAWRPLIAAAAEHPNVACKLSGLVTEADWPSWQPADLAPYIDAALELFGPDRLLFGSDWPVCTLAATYDQVVATARSLVAGLSASERTAIEGGNAARCYNLPDEGPSPLRSLR